jgi:putative DNA primase/helicase
LVTDPVYNEKPPDASEAADRADDHIREVLTEQGIDPNEYSWQFDDDILDSEPLTLSDLGNARRMVYHHGADIRYSHQLGRWYEWDGRRFRPDGSGAIERRAKDTVRRIYHEAAAADDSDRKRIGNFALKSEGKSRIDAMVSLAQSEPNVPIDPADLDRDPRLLNVLNGTIDLRTGELRPHRRQDRITKIAPITFDPNATCPEFETFLQRIMLGRPDLATFLQRALGYSLTGLNSERVLFILYGSGRNGKSTLLETVAGVIGDYAGTAPPEMLLSKREAGIPNDLARLPGTRFVTAVETGEGRRLDEPKVKSISGGDTISARFMRGEWFDFKPTFKLWLGTNHRPVIRGTDHAIWDRIRLIPFDYRVPDDEKIPDLACHLIEQEAPGILAWLVKGCLMWQAEGLGLPDVVAQANTAYRDDMDTLAGFIDEHCVMDESATASAADLYSSYKHWCETAGEKSITKQTFGRSLTERGFDSAQVGKARTRTWIGIGLRASGPDSGQNMSANGHRVNGMGGG